MDLLSSLKSGSPGLGIYGDQSEELVGAVASSSGTSRKSAEHVLGAITPIAAGILGKHVVSQGLDAGGLSSMLMGQRQALVGNPNLPASLGRFLGGGRADVGQYAQAVRPDVSATSAPLRAAEAAHHPHTPWGRIAALALGGLVVLGALFMMCGRHPQRVGTRAVPQVETPVVRAPDIPKPEIQKPEIPKPEAPTVAPPATEVPGETTITGAELEAKNKAMAPADAMSENFVGGKTFPLSEVNFGTGSADARGGDASIDRLAALMKENPDARIRLEGHADSVGTSDINDPLSRQRAEAVKNMLVAKGIAAGRIETAAEGDRAPVASNDTQEGRQRNRRVDVTVLSR
jgi:outer membrane protein OmpA-like peptidoglycan-associated protein